MLLALNHWRPGDPKQGRVDAVTQHFVRLSILAVES
jgi:hypothetical protein